MKTRATGLVVAGLSSFALMVGASSAAHAATPNVIASAQSPASASDSAFGQGKAERAQWIDSFTHSVLDNIAAAGHSSFGEPAGAPADERAEDGGQAAPEAAEAAVPLDQPSVQSQPAKHEPSKHEPQKHGESGGKPGHGKDHGKGQDQDQQEAQDQDQAQQQAQDQDQNQAQGQNVVVTVVVDNKVDNKVDNSNDNDNSNRVDVSQKVEEESVKVHQAKAHHAAPPESEHALKGELAHTGGDEIPLLLGATALIGLGAALLKVRRARRP